MNLEEKFVIVTCVVSYTGIIFMLSGFAPLMGSYLATGGLSCGLLATCLQLINRD